MTPSTSEGRRCRVRTAWPRATSSAATARPRNPEAPVTRTVMARWAFRRRGRARPSRTVAIGRSWSCAGCRRAAAERRARRPGGVPVLERTASVTFGSARPGRVAAGTVSTTATACRSPSGPCRRLPRGARRRPFDFLLRSHRSDRSRRHDHVRQPAFDPEPAASRGARHRRCDATGPGAEASSLIGVTFSLAIREPEPIVMILQVGSRDRRSRRERPARSSACRRRAFGVQRADDHAVRADRRADAHPRVR